MRGNDNVKPPVSDATADGDIVLAGGSQETAPEGVMATTWRLMHDNAFTSTATPLALGMGVLNDG